MIKSAAKLFRCYVAGLLFTFGYCLARTNKGWLVQVSWRRVVILVGPGSYGAFSVCVKELPTILSFRFIFIYQYFFFVICLSVPLGKTYGLHIPDNNISVLLNPCQIRCCSHIHCWPSPGAT